MSTSVKFCTNCKFSEGKNTLVCNHPNNGVDMVSGKSKTYFCSTNRNAEMLCGVYGKWYEETPALKLDYKPSLFMRIIKGILG